MPTDIEIARAVTPLPIAEVAAKLAIPAEAVIPYGRAKAKLSAEFLKSLAGRPRGNLVLVTAMSPTPAGEGKTTTTIGLGDALNRIGKRTMICLREPSLGPVLRPEGRGHRRRPRPGDPHGGHQPPLHRRFPRHHRGAQPARRHDRQPHLLGQRPPHRHPAGWSGAGSWT